MSDRSSTESTGSLTKKKRMYDKTYKTHEPLAGLPEIEFEEKQWDLEDPSPPTTEYEPDSKQQSPKVNEYAEPYDVTPKRHTGQPDINKKFFSSSNPNLLNNNEHFTYSSPEYATVDKERKRVQSQSSIITDV